MPRWSPREAEAEQAKPIDVDAEAMRARLLATLPADPVGWRDEDRARHLLAYLIDWHRREDKAAWWEYFRLRDLAPDDLRREVKALAGLEFVERVGEKRDKRSGRPTGSVFDRYRYPPQEVEIADGDGVASATSSSFGSIVSIDRETRTVVLEKTKSHADEHPASVFVFTHVNNEPVQRAVIAYAESVLERNGAMQDCRDALLFRRTPRLREGTLEGRPGESAGDVAERAGLVLDQSVLAIQGPPGAGKTYTGARMICALVKAGRRVGVAAHSHKVIRNLLDAVARQAAVDTVEVRCGHRRNTASDSPGRVTEVTKGGKDGNREARQLLQSGAVHVLGGTAWLWAGESECDRVDVLFVDEAGQMSLADTLGLSRAAKSLVLLGDQQQLEQPQKAAHPDGVDISALDHVLGGARTVPEGHGLFLPVTWRLSPVARGLHIGVVLRRAPRRAAVARTPGARRRRAVRGGRVSRDRAAPRQSERLG